MLNQDLAGKLLPYEISLFIVNLCCLNNPRQITYRIRLKDVHKRALLRESNPREIALSVWRARRFPRNLGFTNQPDTVFMQMRGSFNWRVGTSLPSLSLLP